MWKELLPSEVVVVEATGSMWTSAPTPAEARRIPNAASRRRGEFQAGRAAARAALHALGIDQFDLISGAYREPLWPEGIIGSITHTLDQCAVAVARRSEITSLGIDLEPEKALSDDLMAIACSESERQFLLRLPDRTPAIWAKVIFSAKEAFFKAYFPKTLTFLEFQDVTIALHPKNGTFEAQLVGDDLPTLFGSRRTVGRYGIRDGLIYTVLATIAS